MEIAMLKRKPASNPDLRKDIAAIRKGLAKAKKCTAELLDGLIETGRALSRAKTKVAHGQWGPWLREHFDMSADTAENYRRISRLSSRPGFRSAAKNLPLEVLYALGRSGVTEEVQEAVFARAAQGERITLSTFRYGVRVEEVAEQKRVISVPVTHETLRLPIPRYISPPLTEPVPSNPVYVPPSRPYDGAADRAIRSLRDFVYSVQSGSTDAERLAARMNDDEVVGLLEDLDFLDNVVRELRQALQRRRGLQLRVVEPGEN
jgi:hypothetical protein